MTDRPAQAAVTKDTGLDGAPLGAVRIQLLRLPDCPLAGPLRSLVERCVARSGVSATLEEVQGAYPSPTLLINGADVTGRRAGAGPSCRLDVPGEEQILAALQRHDWGP